jgi:exopolysaccharide biosynthesis polyprenyl glycosylphosphotransferase
MDKVLSGTKANRVTLPRVHLRGLGLRTSERVLLLLLVDVALLITSLALAVSIRTDWLSSVDAFFALWRWWLTLAIVWWIVAQFLEVYDLARAAIAPQSMLAAGSAAAVAVVLYHMVPVFTPPLLSRGLSLIFLLAAVASVMVWRGLYAVLFVQPAFETRLLVVGAGTAGQALARLFHRDEEEGALNPYRGTGYRVVGFLDDDPRKLGVPQAAGVPVLGPTGELAQVARRLAPDLVVLAITHRNTMSQGAFDALVECRGLGYEVTTMSEVYERALGRVPVEHIGRNIPSVLPVGVRGPGERVYEAAKRGGDVLLAGAFLPLLAAIIPLVALLNLLGNRGPLFYRQVRVGKGGRHFNVTKFRTMLPDAEARTGAVWAAKDDPRITPVGRFLRRTRIDEAPQLLNVLAGDMSLIGPRPERPEFVDSLAQEIPYYRARHAVRPGISGWAQVRFGYGNTVDDARTKLEYDLYYVRHAGFYLDALIVLKTLATMLKLQGR